MISKNAAATVNRIQKTTWSIQKLLIVIWKLLKVEKEQTH